MGNLENNLNAILDIEPTVNLPVEYVESTAVVATSPATNTPLDVETQSDYETARSTFRKLITTGEKAIDDLADIAVETEHPRAFEVLSTMMNTIRETAKDLLGNQVQRKNLLGVVDGNKKLMSNGGVEVQNAIFVGTLAELQDQRKKNKA